MKKANVIAVLTFTLSMLAWACTSEPSLTVITGSWEASPEFYEKLHAKKKASEAGNLELFTLRVYYDIAEEDGSLFMIASTNASPRKIKQYKILRKDGLVIAEPINSETLPILPIKIHGPDSIILSHPSQGDIPLRRRKDV